MSVRGAQIKMALLVGLAIAAAVVLLATSSRTPDSGIVTVFAAASLQEAVTDALGEARLSASTRVSFAASSTLARQIEAGAPADVFISANSAWVDYLAARGLVQNATRQRFAGNRLVLVGTTDSPLHGAALTDLPRLLGTDDRLAVGDPDHVPAGIYAREALRAAGVWDETDARLARADSVRAALALVTTGSAPLAIVYVTDTGTEDAAGQGVSVLSTIDPALHSPIVYEIVALNSRRHGSATNDASAERSVVRQPRSPASGAGGDDAHAVALQAVWLALTGAPARNALRHHGFVVE